MKIKFIKCRLIGHDVSDDYTDSGTYICKRCRSHAYYDYDKGKWSKTPILMLPKEIYIRIKRKIIAYQTRNDLPF